MYQPFGLKRPLPLGLVRVLHLIPEGQSFPLPGPKARVSDQIDIERPGGVDIHGGEPRQSCVGRLVGGSCGGVACSLASGGRAAAVAKIGRRSERLILERNSRLSLALTFRFGQTFAIFTEGCAVARMASTILPNLPEADHVAGTRRDTALPMTHPAQN
jgi:hypothetical protein